MEQVGGPVSKGFFPLTHAFILKCFLSNYYMPGPEDTMRKEAMLCPQGILPSKLSTGM